MGAMAETNGQPTERRWELLGLAVVLLAAVTLALSFFPTPGYRRWVEARAAAQQL